MTLSDSAAPAATPRRGRRRLIVLVSVLVVAVLTAAGIHIYRRYSVTRFTADHGRITVERAAIGQLGPVLVTNKGFALYVFPPDAAREVTCTGGCAFAWPPLTVPEGGDVAAGPGVRADLLGTAPSPDGGRVVTYHGWPLYTYLGDADPGRAAGQAVNADGGYWYVITPSGRVVTR